LVNAADPAQVSIMQPMKFSPGIGEDGTPVLQPGFDPGKGWDAADAVEQGWTADHIRLLPEEIFEEVPADSSYHVDDGRCPRRAKFEPPCRPNSEPVINADRVRVGCG
jgi:hypothetical protein